MRPGADDVDDDEAAAEENGERHDPGGEVEAFGRRNGQDLEPLPADEAGDNGFLVLTLIEEFGDLLSLAARETAVALVQRPPGAGPAETRHFLGDELDLVDGGGFGGPTGPKGRERQQRRWR